VPFVLQSFDEPLPFISVLILLKLHDRESSVEGSI